MSGRSQQSKDLRDIMQPERMKFAVSQLEKAGINCIIRMKKKYNFTGKDHLLNSFLLLAGIQARQLRTDAD